MDTTNPTPLETLGDLATSIILSKLNSSEAASLSCVNQHFKHLASDIWFSICHQELQLSEPVDPSGNTCASFKAAYGAWREAYGMYPWPLVMRVKNVWDRIRSWLTDNFPEVLPTLRKGASEDELNELEELLEVKLPIPTRVIYRFCDGQDLSSGSEHTRKSSCGLIGGYSFPKYFVNVFLLPLNIVILETKEIVRRQFRFPRPRYVIVAAASTMNEKILLLDCEEGQLYVGTKNILLNHGMMPCVPNGLITSVHGSKSGSQQDAMLLWLEEHVLRLETGIIKLRDEESIWRICQFPEQSPLCSEATTCGVQVRASAVFVPEFSYRTDKEEKYVFLYSIRLSLKSEGCVVDGVSYDSCQLYSRNWLIKSDDPDTVVGRVSAESVIGQYPLLLPGEKEFIYESCSNLPASSGSIEGSFTFYPGSLIDPKGSPFEVEVAKFPLQLPDYIF